MEEVIYGLQAQIKQLKKQALTQAPMNALMKPDKPSSFSGDRNESIETWIFQMEWYARLTKIHANHQVKFATSFLKKNATSWWMVKYKWQETAGNELDWDNFTKKLWSRFKPVNAEENARDWLGKLKQTGSVAAYSHMFRIITQDLPDMHEGDLLHYYKKGLKEQVTIQVGLWGPLNIEEAE